MKISIIIPVYNVEKYIEKCIRSCMKQDLTSDDYEIIIVNDGTKDRSMDVVNRVIVGSNNIKVYTQENKGLSVARNTGLSYAKGDYVWFVDSDDYLEDNCLGTLCGFLDGNLDILQIQYRYTYENGAPDKDANKTIILGKKTGKEVLKNGGVDIPAQFSIYRRNFLLDNNLEFYPHIYHEDVDFKPRAVYYANSIMSYNEVVYNYLQRENSITSKRGLKHATDLITISDRIYNFSKNFDIIDVSYFASVISCCINWVLIIIDNLSEEEKKGIFETLKSKKYLISAMKKSQELRYRLEACLLLFNLKMGRWAYLRLR